MSVGICTMEPEAADDDPLAWFEGLLAALGARRFGRKWQCPGHGLVGDHSAALSISRGTDGRLLMYCHAGCTWREVLAALKLPRTALVTPQGVSPARWRSAILPGVTFPPMRCDHGESSGWVATSIVDHTYGDPAPIAWKVRERNAAGVKRVRWESLNPKGERVPGLLGRAEIELPLYRIREVRMAIASGETVILVESESSVDALGKAGLYATTWAGGASSPPLDRIQRELRNANVLLVPDYDDAGLACAERIVTVLPDARVQLGEVGEDARDVLTRCGAAWFR